MNNLMKIILCFVALSMLASCAGIKETGRTIGHTTRDVTKKIGHTSRDAVKAIGKETKEVVKDIKDNED
ncbi:hypothetical protein [Rheinheimera sp. 1928-s]|uniref:hypothetical protein n=1 Tax=Rheinheimera sp. 1928-s TaxID=3033803 RepID=UPI00262DE893|nr:hypothetical protein [Rheinheimera sp. 1928-s]MDF3126494.1 hypothetical protein [Rheinheimera sp. 1928-s]